MGSSRIQPSILQGRYEFEKMKWLENPPVRLFDQADITVQFGPAEIILRWFGHIDTDHPSLLLLHVFQPFLIIILIPAMKIKHILGNQDEFKNTLRHEFIC